MVALRLLKLYSQLTDHHIALISEFSKVYIFKRDRNMLIFVCLKLAFGFNNLIYLTLNNAFRLSEQGTWSSLDVALHPPL